MAKVYDVAILGAGPAGLAAGLYAGRAKLNTLILEKGVVGGQISITDEVANYPGVTGHPRGAELSAKMREQAEEFGAQIVKDEITGLCLTQPTKALIGKNAEYHAHAVIIATGGRPRQLGCPGEIELTGKGVSYCATCDANFFTDLEVFVIGGGDAAVEEAEYLTKFARKVTIVHRRDKLRAAGSITERAAANPKIFYLWDTVVEEIIGDGIVEAIVFKNVKTSELTRYDADEGDGTFGIFPFIGFIPVSGLFKGLVKMDEAGYIVTDADMHTDIPGVFAAGDVRVKSLRQVATAVADGAIAATQAVRFLEERF